MSSRAFVGSALGWSDLNFGGIFENGHIVADQVYFYESDSRKSATFAAGGQSFYFQKITETLKITVIFFLKIHKYLHFTSKNMVKVNIIF